MAAPVLPRPGIGDLSEALTACGIAENGHRNLDFTSCVSTGNAKRKLTRSRPYDELIPVE
jgi:hypothetical protein